MCNSIHGRRTEEDILFITTHSSSDDVCCAVGINQSDSRAQFAFFILHLLSRSLNSLFAISEIY